MRRLLHLAVILAPLAAVAAPPPPKAPSPPLPATATVQTEHGSFVIRFLPEVAPRHVAHFAAVARKGGFDGTTFHRIVPRGIIQGGDPLSRDPKLAARYGTGGLGLLKAELSPRPIVRGTVAAVRRPSDLNSAGNQFFICLADQTALNGQFTVFGEITEGMDVVDRIGETPVEGDKAKVRVVIRAVTLADAPAKD